MGSEKLKSEFDLSSTKQAHFMEELDRQCVKQSFQGTILTINGVYFLRNYGTFTYAMILAHVMAYSFRSNREEQDATSLLNCLEDTLIPSDLDIINSERSKYTLTRAQVNATLSPGNQLQGNADDEYQDGVLFLWCILNRTAPQTNATVTTIVRQLYRINNILEEAKYDVFVFNTKVRLLLNQYVANTGSEFDRTILLTSLFEAYKLPTNQEFNTFIVRTEQDHNFNTAITTADILMESALKLCQTKTLDGSWDKLSTDQKQAINLMAQFKSFKTKFTPPASKGQGTKNNGQNNQSNAEECMKKKYDKAPDWKKKKPDDIDAPHIQHGKTYYWCTKHQMFTVHKSADCKLPKSNNFYQANKKNKNKNGSSGGSKNDGKHGNSRRNSDKTKQEMSTETRLKYTGGTTNISIDSKYGDY
jgi:hypothetical protein